MESLSIFTIISIAFLGSFGHCIGMCGGIVIAYTSKKIPSNISKKEESIYHLLYSLGRVSTYTTLGLIIGFMGSLSLYSQKFNAIFLIFVGIFMLLVGISISGKLKFLSIIEISFSKYSWYSNSFKKLLNTKSLKSFYFLGALNGLMPCGFVYVFIIMALGTSSPLYGALVMFIFGMSTIPAMFSFSYFISLFQKNVYRVYFINTASVLVVFYAIYTIYKGYNLYI